MDDEDCQNAENEVVAKTVETVEGDVLLQDSLVSVPAGPVALLGAVGGFNGSGFICSGGSSEMVSLTCGLLEIIRRTRIPGCFNF
jgi:hypothetical protein